MTEKMQVTLTGNESKRLIALAAKQLLIVEDRLNNGSSVLLMGGTTVSALSEVLGYGAMRISGRIDATGTRTALNPSSRPHNLMIRSQREFNADSHISAVVSGMGPRDLIVIGANALDHLGRAAIAFAAKDGGSRGQALVSARQLGIPLLILCSLNKLVPDLAPALEASADCSADCSLGAAVSLFPLSGTILTESVAFEQLFSVHAVTIAGSGIGSGEGSRTFLLTGESDDLNAAWNTVIQLKGSALSGDPESLTVCKGGCSACKRHNGCIYKKA